MIRWRIRLIREWKWAGEIFRVQFLIQRTGHVDTETHGCVVLPCFTDEPAQTLEWRGIRRALRRLADDLRHNIAENVCEPEVAALVAPGELLMIEAELMEQGGIQIVHVNGLFQGAEA